MWPDRAMRDQRAEQASAQSSGGGGQAKTHEGGLGRKSKVLRPSAEEWHPHYHKPLGQEELGTIEKGREDMLKSTSNVHLEISVPVQQGVSSG